MTRAVSTSELLTYVDMNMMNSRCLAEPFSQPTLPILMIPAVKSRFTLILITLLNLLFLTLRGGYIHNKVTIGPFIRGKIRRVLHKTRTFRINGTFRLK